ncbi:hypothetical protein [Sanguibacter inulinus]|uniref:Uncharacterized protein n=1 Tax=Sanguibacter inulinus TaxID=60922 RepID=A0A853ET16_9MICO|nr:hypothetical protein [Sanguibacter inulinus]MBF0722590.1 hypothetical protein [Sanguibacter inulinus]NYS93735.1 hypothetical protein [Sanguibacter inulinus]
MTTEQDELFQAWLEEMHPRLARFEDLTMPAGWPGGYSRESLVALEQHILDRWPDKKSFLDENDTDFIEGATRYIGETYLRLAGGGWSINHDPEFIYTGRPVVRFDTESPMPVSPVHLMTTILARRTGNVLSRIWDGQTAAVERRREAEGPGWQPRRDPVPGVVAAQGPSSSELDAWIQRVPQLVDSLRSRAGARAARLDLTLASLEPLGELALEDVDGGRLSRETYGDVKASYVAYLGAVALRAAGGAWVLVPGERDDSNPFVGRPYVERFDESGDRRTAALEPAVDKVAVSRDASVLSRIVGGYAG